MELLLLDMDGVLLHPNGYHEALRDNVRMWADALGFEGADLSRDAIHFFESAGVSAEWVSGSMCVGLMMVERWKHEPALQIPSSLHPLRSPVLRRSPDFGNFAREVLDASDHRRPVETGIRLLESRCATREQAVQLRQLVESATSFQHSPFHRIQQELVLGSELMRDVYGVEPVLDSRGYLLTRDRPAVSENCRAQLLAWRGHAGQEAVVMTNRPTRAPDGKRGSPEAELGLQLLGLEALPVAGMGAVNWLAEKAGLTAEARLKPHAAHALAAIRLSTGEGMAASLTAVAALLDEGEVDAGWRALDGASITVLEDSVNGCLSALDAGERLRKAGIEVAINLVGVAESGAKRRVLDGLGASLYASSEAALQAARVCDGS